MLGTMNILQRMQLYWINKAIFCGCFAFTGIWILSDVLLAHYVKYMTYIFHVYVNDFKEMDETYSIPYVDIWNNLLSDKE